MLLRILDISVTIKQVDLGKGQQYDEEFLKLNPSHQIPVLVDGDFVVSQSRAIMTYLVNSKRPGSPLYPVNSKARARVDSRLFFDAITLFETNAMAIVSWYKKSQRFNLMTEIWKTLRLFKRCVFLENATRISDERKQKVDESIQMLETFLADDEWFSGKVMTISDVSILATITQLDFCGYNFSKYPKLQAWYERCKKLPCYKENAAGAALMGDMFKSRLEAGGGFNWMIYNRLPLSQSGAQNK